MQRFNAFSKHKDELLTLLVLVLVSVGFMVCSAFSDISFKPKRLGLDVFTFFQRGMVSVGNFFSESLNSISELGTLQKRYRNLVEEYAVCEQVRHDSIILEQENAELRKQLEYQKRENFSKISAIVIGGSPGNFYDSIVINKGSDKGIEKDMPVIAYADGYQSLVGKVVEVGKFSSIVQPITDGNLYVPAMLQKLRYRGLVNRNMMDFVKKEAGPRITCGDVVVTSGFNGGYPANIFIGKVKSVASRDFETSLRLELDLFVDFDRLEYVFVLKQESPDEE